MYPSGSSMYQHPRMAVMGQTDIGSVPGAIPMHYPSQGNMGMQGAPMSQNHTNYTHKTHHGRMPDHNTQRMLDHNTLKMQDPNVQRMPDHDKQKMSVNDTQRMPELKMQQHSIQPSLTKEVAGEGCDSDRNLPKTDALLHDNENNANRSTVADEGKVKTEREEDISNFMETARDIFVQISNNELKIKEAADLLGRPYSFVYGRYQEYSASVNGKWTVIKKNGRKRIVLKKNGKQVRRPKKLTMKKNRPIETGEIYQCKECPAVFNRQKSIKLHSKVHNPNNKKACDCTVCGLVFPRITQLMNHRLDVHGDALQCPHCDKQYTFVESYKIHVRTHTKVKPYVCDECGKGFFTKFNLDTHYRMHTGERPFMCGYCEKTFTTVRFLQQHLLCHTGRKPMPKPYECHMCDNKYTTKHDLEQHINTHTGRKPYACDQCDERFNFQQGLKRHMMRHEGIRPYKCDYCPADFCLSTDLKTHSMAHTGNKPFKCDLCDYSATRKHILEYHKYTHTGERPFKCDFYGCSAEYSRPSALKFHQQKHGPPPLKTCKVCKEKFPDLNSLKLHMMIHPGHKPVQCEQCDKIFYNESTLKRHMHTHMYKRPRDKPKQVRKRNNNPGIKTKRGKKSGITEKQMISEYQASTAAGSGYTLPFTHSILNYQY